MKVKIKDLEPNPFRDWDNFQPDRALVDLLKISIKETFFWENLIGRKSNGKIEIAYGHHRLIALRELYPKGDKIIDIPTYPLGDEKMLKIMATENETGRNLSISHVDLIVKKAKEFLEANPDIAKKYTKKYLKREAGRELISNFLGWDSTRIKNSLERQKLGHGPVSILDKEAVESLPSERAARDFTKAVKKARVTPEIQKKVAKKIVESRQKESEDRAIYGERIMTAELLQEKLGFSDKKKKEKEFAEYIEECSKLINTLNRKLETLINFKSDFDSAYYKETFERFSFDTSIDMLRVRLKQLLKEDK